jgi:two-component system chemotaxis response regulator CheB
MEALSLGASDFIMKPTGSVSEDVRAVQAHLTDMLYAYGARYRTRRGKPVQRRPIEGAEKPKDFFSGQRSAVPAAPIPGAEIRGIRAEPSYRVAYDQAQKPAERIVPVRKPGNTEIIVIGISTGGPNALREIFAKLDGDLTPPIVVVQHMPAGFTAEFAKSLDRICPLEVKEAEDGDVLKPGRILIAPGDRHIEVEKRSLAAVAHLSEAPPMNGHRPSADVLFSSVAREYGNRALAVIMTGMGRDGAKEIGTIFKEGGLTIGQDEVSCIVYGMPKVAWELGNLMEQVPLTEMAARICALAKQQR